MKTTKKIRTNKKQTDYRHIYVIFVTVSKFFMDAVVLCFVFGDVEGSKCSGCDTDTSHHARAHCYPLL